ncbi:unnamed protein product [Lathyrus sativus]|nr:unnamed protein product [Lathyrus sativus]
MAHTLPLQFLTVLIFFIMNGQVITARDLKAVLRDHKQGDSDEESYIAGYRTRIHGSNEPYLTSYGNHETKKFDYITGYRTHAQDSNEPYLTGYANHDIKKSDYITGYRTHAQDSNEPYLTSYGNHDAKKSDYITGYRTHAQDSNELYLTGYANHDDKKIDYITGYRTHAQDSNEPYQTSYSNHAAKKSDYITGYRNHAQDSNKPYLNGYGNHDAMKSDYIAGYRTHAQDSNEPYLTDYSNHEVKQPNYITNYRTQSHNSNKPYITNYDNHELNQPDYITGYRTHAHESNGPYITSYGKHESNQPYITQYRPPSLNLKGLTSLNSKDIEGHASPNMDRTEAFKTGFFNLDDIHVGNVMTLQFPVQEVSPYLPKKEADSIPLSKSQLPSVLQLFSISEDSTQAKSMRGTLEECEGETITGETKICANSLESMLEFVDTIIGSNTKHNILSTSKPSPTATHLQKYTILEVSHDIHAPKWVACHPLPYPYAIYYCHYISTGTKVFKVMLVGDDNGDKMEALGICHLDTSDWNPDHVVFRQLGIKAGKNTPVCHFFPVNHLLWVPVEPTKATV